MRRNCASSAGRWKIPCAGRAAAAAPGGGARSASCIPGSLGPHVPGSWAGPAASGAPPKPPSFGALSGQSPCRSCFCFCFSLKFPPPLCERSCQQIKERLARVCVYWGEPCGGISPSGEECAGGVCDISHRPQPPPCPPKPLSPACNRPSGSSSGLYNPISMRRMNESTTFLDPSTRNYWHPFGSGWWVLESEGFRNRQRCVYI